MPDDRHLEASGLAVQGLHGDPGVGADASIDVATDPLTSGVLSISVVMYRSIDGARITPALVRVELIRRPAA